MHADDLQMLGIGDGELVRLRSRRGEIVLKARASKRMSRGAVRPSFHFKEAAANVLTIDALDPYGKIPEFKFCAVRVERLRLKGEEGAWLKRTPGNCCAHSA